MKDLKLTTEEVARIFDRSLQTLYFWLAYKNLGKYGKKEKRVWYFSSDDLKRFLQEDAIHWMSKAEWESCMERLKQEGGGQHRADLAG